MKTAQPRLWDTPSAAILLAAVLLSAWRLQTAGWADAMQQAGNAAVIGCLVGLALGYSHFGRRGVSLLVPAYTFVILTWQLLGAISFGSDQNYLGDQLRILAGRLITDMNLLRSGRAVEDQFFVVALMCLPYWFASLYCGYQLARRANFLRAVLPNGILMLIVHAYHYTSRDYSWMFGVYLFFALLLLSRLKFLEDRKKWALARVQVSSESGLDITNTTLTAAAVVLFLAWSVPYILPATAQGREFWRNTYGEIFPPGRFENIFASVDKESRPVPRNFQTELALGSHTSQSDQALFRVFTPSNAADLPRLYWRGQVYDRYENGRWQTTGETESRRAPAKGEFEIPDASHNRRLGFTFDVLVNGQSTLFTPAQPIWVNREAILLYSALPGDAEDDDFEEPVLDVKAMRASPALEAGDLYRASALMPNPSKAELREAGTAYPVWVLKTYLQLPDDFSPRIRELALRVTAPYDNPFDKALAVTNFLRNEIEYAPAVSLPDETVDPLEHVLFDSKQGFCNYYATAEVLMLRAAGIPARLAVGYAQGEPNLQDSIYVVRERDFHAWPEVYFPEYGWVEFEPTGNQDPLERPERRAEIADAAPAANPIVPLAQLEEDEPPPVEQKQQEEETAIPAWQAALFPALLWLSGAAVFLLAFALKRRYAPHVTAASVLKRAIERSGWTPPRWMREWVAFANQPEIERLFHSVNLSLKWMKRPQALHVTAAERAWILKHVLPSAAGSIETLLNEHQTELFTPRGGDAALARRAALDILYKSLQRRLKMLILGYNYAEVQDTPRYPL